MAEERPRIGLRFEQIIEINITHRVTESYAKLNVFARMTMRDTKVGITIFPFRICIESRPVSCYAPATATRRMCDSVAAIRLQADMNPTSPEDRQSG